MTKGEQREALRQTVLLGVRATKAVYMAAWPELCSFWSGESPVLEEVREAGKQVEKALESLERLVRSA